MLNQINFIVSKAW